jgi:penicillin-binding protein 1B
VRRQLATDYARDDLERTGLVVLATLDPAVQAAAERALGDGLKALGPKAAELDGAVVVTSPHTGEVQALVGSRRTDIERNRALDARRPVARSSNRPCLAALESGRYSLASVIDDAPIIAPAEQRQLAAKRRDQAHGLVHSCARY